MQSVNTFKYVFLSLQNRCTLHLDPLEFQVAIKWWLGLPTSQGQVCPQCSSHFLDYFGHRALTCRKGPDVVTRHNTIRDTVFELCQRACLEAQLEAGSSLGHEERQIRPADILVPNWELGQPAAIDFSITSPLCHENIQVASVMTWSAALWAEKRKPNTRLGIDPFGGRIVWLLGNRSTAFLL